MCPRDGNGSYSRPVSDYVFDTVISETSINTEMDQIATALTDSIAKDGQTTPTADLPMGGFKHTGVDNAALRDQYLAAGQLQDGGINWALAEGTADAITASYSPAVTDLVDGMLLGVRALLANTSDSPTFSPNGVTAKTITMVGGAKLVAGSIDGADHELLLRYNLTRDRWDLLNPAVVGSAITGVDATKLDSLDSTQFLRSDVADTKTGSLSMDSPLIITENAAGIELHAYTINGIWAEFYSNAANHAIRTGYVGNGTASNFSVSLGADTAGADIILAPGSGGVANVGTDEIWHAGNVDDAPGLNALKGATGYVDLPGGLTFQWGSISISGNASANDSFAKSFPSVCLQAVAAATQNGTDGQNEVTVIGISKTAITILNASDSSQTARWMAIGY